VKVTDMDTYDGPQPAAGPDSVRPFTPFGYTPALLRRAYSLPSGQGAGRTVAIVDAFNDTHAQSDLATYRRMFGLPPCTTANRCFKKVNQNGGRRRYPKANADWAGEISLDLDMVSAICPSCHILLVEASSGNISNLGTAVNTAVRLGAKFVSNSYGAPESSADPRYDRLYFNHPGVAITASAGDNGYATSYPAASRYVTAVGGTTLKPSGNARGFTETVWGDAGSGGTGSGCSGHDAKPAWQTDGGCRRRTATDVAAVADPDTGVAVYDRGWAVYGGTSASSPIIAAIYALAGNPAAGTYPSSYPYRHRSGLHDVTSGRDGSCRISYLCRARVGFDGPTGIGTPDGDRAFAAR
jgi:subtilase family serine protease